MTHYVMCLFVLLYLVRIGLSNLRRERNWEVDYYEFKLDGLDFKAD